MKTILVLEDNADEAFLLSRALRYTGLPCDPVFVRNGKEAIEYLQDTSSSRGRHLPDLILVDISMPDLDGLGFLQWFRTKPGLQQVPIIILTNSIDSEDKSEADRLGVQAYFVKPSNSDALFTLIKEIQQTWLHAA